MNARPFSFCRCILGCTVVLALGLSAARAQNILYVTDGVNQKLQAIDVTTGSILYTVTTSAGALPIAVRNTISLGSFQNAGLSGEYNPANGALIGSLQTPSGINWEPTYDGAASATANFTASNAGGGPYTIYQTAPDWSSPIALFTVGINPYGIAYDTASDTFWINSGQIYQFTSTGSLVSNIPSYGSGSGSNYEYSGMAYQASTDTLWIVPNNSSAALRQYAKDGTLLQTLFVPGRFGSTFGAEFAVIPEPSTYGLIGGLAAMLLVLARRRRAA